MTQPTFVYDDDCGFCTWWAARIAEHTDLRIVGFGDLDPALESRLPADFERCSHLVTDDEIYSCGAAIEEALLRTELGSLARPPVTLLRRFGPYRSVRELKGEGRPIHSQEERAEVLLALEWVDYVAVFEERDCVDADDPNGS